MYPTRSFDNKTLTQFATALVLVMMGITTACTADIRPDELKRVDRPDDTAAQRGHTLLEEAARAHGIEAWSGVNTYTMELHDEWRGVMPRMINPWPRDEINVRMSYRAGSFDGYAEFLDGDLEGMRWGIQSWRTYETREAGKPQFVENDDARFMLPAVQYLTEFPFRDHTDQIVSDIGPEEVGGVTYDRVFLTWDTLEPSPRVDQYIVYIDQNTRQIKKLHYTARDMMKFAKGTIHYEDIRDIDGVHIPFTQVITNNVHDELSEFAHKITLTSFQINQQPVSAFIVDPALPELGDEKTSSL